MDALDFLAGSFYLLISLFIFIRISRNNLFWCYFLAIEYFFIIGLGFYPMLRALGFVDKPDFINENVVSILIPLHIISYAIGAFWGFSSGSKRIALRVTDFAVKLNVDARKSFFFVFSICVVFFILYVSNVGLEQALLGASFARMGEFDYFDTGAKFAFLTRPMMIGLLTASYAYFFIFIERRPYRYLFSSVCIGMAIYSVTVSRYALLEAIVLPFLIYVIYLLRRGVVGKILAFSILGLGFAFALAVFIYGKFILYQIANYFVTGESINLNVEGNQGADFGAFAHLYYSIGAGAENFFNKGIVFFKDILLSPLGILPSSTLDAIGLASLSYQFVPPEESFSCVNTSLAANIPGCFIPPYFTGASAYFSPIFGGLLFGFIRFYVYRIVSMSWDALERIGKAKDIPVLLVLFYFFEQTMLFIPATISLSVFMLIMAILAVKLKIVKKG
ncbi:hypothetical protein Cthiooxydans_43760 [Comamonas thiooxydans]|uniref:hypothetical protein n=1 Tax=Comamonas thiooxydans TaxID=363952 RepID=UPI001E595F83|nr:hypothetical protein [Comamonas thiooxydans]BDB71964.1 hypothetical protein Cthiooxydans_43760 [Comamonas thiooxydans]